MPAKKRSAKSTKSKEVAASSEEEDDWEEVEENNLDTSQVDIQNDVEIEVDLPDVVKKQQKKKQLIKEWLETLIKRAYNKGKKEIHQKMHQAHLLCLLCVGIQTNKICNDYELQSFALSVVPVEFVETMPKKLSMEKLTRLMKWINSSYRGNELVENNLQKLPDKKAALISILEGGMASNRIDLILLHLVMYRCMGIQARLVMSLQPVSYKPPTAKQLAEKATKIREFVEKFNSKKKKSNKSSDVEDKVEIPQVDGANDPEPKLRRSTRNRPAAILAEKAKLSKMNNNNNNSVSKKSSAKVVKSKYKFAASKRENAKTKSDLSESDSDSDFEETNSVDITRPSRDISPAKKISKIMKSKSKVVVKKENIKPSDVSSVKATQKTNKLENVDSDSDFDETKPVDIKPTRDISPAKKISKILKSKVEMKQESVNRSDTKLNSIPEDNVEKQGASKSKRLQTRKLKHEEKDKDETSEVDEPSSSESEDDFIEPKRKRKAKTSTLKPNTATKSSPTSTKQGVSSTKSKSPMRPKANRSKETHNEWLEVYIPKTGWIHVDCISEIINDPKSAESSATQPVHYVITFDNDSAIKDVTARYASGWLTTTRKLRISYVESDWWNNTMKMFKTKKKAMDNEENKQLESDLLAQPLPTSIAAFKDHPLFVIRRHLLKYEAIYPPDTPVIGFVRGEEILPRSSVHVLHTREKWLQSALSVCEGEEPYKMVASFLLNKKLNRDSATPSLPLFGKWQTETYKPPVAKDGKVPRNDFGNVDLFQPSMLPIGCVHLQLAGLQTVARKLNIDVSPAIVGFDTHSGYPHPVLDGYVACKEHEKILREAWKEDQVHAAERAKEKREQKIYGMWKKLIRGLTALERVRRKYEQGEESSQDLHTSLTNGGANWKSQKLEEAKKKEQGKKRTRRATKKKTVEEKLPFEMETM
uniref:DNA repair protein complementing XP-C cells-like n=1 Tax=Phallusia mammillata TaxID=59560 RepID=A0A6F9DX96_9ASCI|nr:DNA repair protein complementing XP-C cells-like [Phallusia mammillata]